MGSVYKRTKSEKRYTIQWQGQDGRMKRRRVKGDKDTARALLTKEEQRVARGEAGLLDPFEQTKRTPITQLVNDYVTFLCRGRHATGYVKQVREQLLLAVEVMATRVLPDITVPKAEAFLARLLEGDGLPPTKPRTKGGQPIPRKPLSPPTRDNYAQAMRAFGVWLLRRKLWPVDPFNGLEDIADDGDTTMEHRAWTPDQIGLLIEAATTRAVQQWAATHQGSDPAALAAKLDELRAEGQRRAILYEFAGYTALRLNECRTLTWGDVVLDGPEPCVTVKARNSKNRKKNQTVPLVPWVVAGLKELRRLNNEDAARAGRPLLAQSDRVFSIKRGLLESLRKDARWAGLGDHDEQGRRTTFHGFRASTCTMLHRAGITLAVTVRIMRHADPKLTIDTYAKLDALADGHRELAKMQLPKVTAVPMALGVLAGVAERPRLAVGGGAWPIVAGIVAAQPPVPPRDRPSVADTGRSGPTAEMVGVAGVEPATLSLSS